MIIWKKDWVPYIIYSVLALCILGGLLSSGYVLTLDLYFTPSLHYTNYFWGLSEWSTSVSATATASTPFFLLVQLLAKIIPTWVIEKLILFLLLFVSGWGAHRLIPGRIPGRYFAGLIYMINPFVYTRFLAGQWVVLWTYALLPIAVGTFIKLLHNGGWKNIILTSTLATIVGIVYIQGYFLLFLACFIIFLIKIIKEHHVRSKILYLLKWTVPTIGVFCILNIYWLLPLFLIRETILTQLSQADLLAFAPQNTSNFGIAFNVASMNGFWREGYIYIKDLLPFWWLFFIFILFLAIYGFMSKTFFSAFNPEPGDNLIPLAGNKTIQLEGPWIVASFALIGVVGFILTLGAANTYTKHLFEWLWNNISFFKGFRDSQQFVMLICLSYAFLGGLGVNELSRGLKKRMKQLPRMGMITLISVALFTPVAYSFTEFDFYGQLGVTDYPKEWYAVNEYLNQDKIDFNVLFLPWHEYMDYSWLPNNDKRLGNPAQQFFDKPIIAGDNIEFSGIYSESMDPVSKYVEFLLNNGNGVSNLGELLAPLNVKYIILVDEADYQLYDYLYEQKDLKIVMEKQGVTLFENEHSTARTYAVDSVIPINNLNEYLELSKKQDVMDHVYVIGNKSSDCNTSQMEKLGLEEKNLVKYMVEGSSLKYTIFTVPQNVSPDSWKYDDKKPMLYNLGFMPTFISTPGGGEIVYTRFYRVYLPCYIISALTLSFMGYYYFRYYKRK